MNPHGFPSRMTVGKMIELVAGKAGVFEGRQGKTRVDVIKIEQNKIEQNRTEQNRTGQDRMILNRIKWNDIEQSEVEESDIVQYTTERSINGNRRKLKSDKKVLLRVEKWKDKRELMCLNGEEESTFVVQMSGDDLSKSESEIESVENLAPINFNSL